MPVVRVERRPRCRERDGDRVDREVAAGEVGIDVGDRRHLRQGARLGVGLGPRGGDVDLEAVELDLGGREALVLEQLAAEPRREAGPRPPRPRGRCCPTVRGRGAGPAPRLRRGRGGPPSARRSPPAPGRRDERLVRVSRRRWVASVRPFLTMIAFPDGRPAESRGRGARSPRAAAGPPRGSAQRDQAPPPGRRRNLPRRHRRGRRHRCGPRHRWQPRQPPIEVAVLPA